MRRAMFALSALVCLVSFSASADIPEFLACADKADRGERLACYDASVAKLKADVVAEQTRKRSLFGFTLPSLGRSDSKPEPEQPAIVTTQELTEIEAKVSGMADDGFGHAVLTLDNGEVWKVQDQKLIPISAARSKGVVIVKNMFGGYYLSVVGQQNNLSVVRVR